MVSRRLHEVECLAAAELADDDAVRTHAQRGLEELADGDLAAALRVGGAAFERDGHFAGSPDDLRDGYIHMSTAEQLEGTRAKQIAQATQEFHTITQRSVQAQRESDRRSASLSPASGGNRRAAA